MIRELLTRLTEAGANGFNMKISQSGEQALVIIQPSLNPMPYKSCPEGLKIHAAMQSPLIIKAGLDELDTELHVLVGDYLASFEGAMQASNVKEVVTKHTAASLTELESKNPATSNSSKTANKSKPDAASNPVSKQAPKPAEECEGQNQQPAEPVSSMDDFESLFLTDDNNQ